MIPSAPFSMSRGTSSRTTDSLDHDLHGEPGRVVQPGDGGGGEAGKEADNLLEARLRHVHLQADHVLRGKGAAQEQRDVLDLAPLHRVLHGRLVGDELRVRLQEGVHDLQAVGAQRRARLGHLDDGVHQAVDGLGLRGAPGELHLHRDVPLGEVALREADELRGDGLSRAVLELWMGEEAGQARPTAPWWCSPSSRSGR